MSNDVVTQQEAGYLALNEDDFLSRLGGVVNNLKGGSNYSYLKFDGNTGQYSYGADNVELPVGSQLAMDFRSFRTGWIIWVGGEVEHETMVDPVYETVPKKTALPDFGPYGKDDGPREQQSIKFKLIEEPFLELLFQANNKSKMNALGALMKSFMASYKMHPGHYSIIEIDSNSFEAKDPDNPKRKFKKFAPKLKIVDWISADELNAMSEGSPEEYENEEQNVGEAQAALPAPEEVENTSPTQQQTRPASVSRPPARPIARPAAGTAAPNAAPAPAAQTAAPAGRRGRF